MGALAPAYAPPFLDQAVTGTPRYGGPVRQGTTFHSVLYGAITGSRMDRDISNAFGSARQPIYPTKDLIF